MKMAKPGNCLNQVAVLKYNGGNECQGDLVGVPIKSTSSTTTSLLDEFTFCAKYYFRFLRECFLMSMEPTFYLEIWDFENKVGLLMYQGIYYRFYFYNQTLMPNSWQYICLAVSPMEMKLVWNGEILSSHTKVDLPKEEIKDTKIWLGGLAASFDKLGNRFEGMMANANLWKITLQDDDLISITANNKTLNRSTAKYDDLLSIAITKNSSCIENYFLDENDELFNEFQPDNILLMEVKNDFESSKYLCQGYGGNLILPKNDEDLKTIGDLMKQSEVCDYAFLGLKKSSTNEKILDLNDNHVPYLKWGLNQPNGGVTQKCISIDSDSVIYDEECYMTHCFVCQIPEKNKFVLRGQVPADTERNYFVTVNRKLTEIRGIAKTECLWNEGKWNFGLNLKLDNWTPVGLQYWNNGKKLKFTQCKTHEFTCYTFGHCISMNKRCDGHPDCPLDGSDENECEIMTLGKGYDKRHPPFKNVTTFINMIVYDILDIDELHMSFTVDFGIKLYWYDSRIVFKNLKPTGYENKLDTSEIRKIWTPQLYFNNSFYFYMTAGQKSEGIIGNVVVHQRGPPQQNALSEIDEDYLYPGIENPISMENYFVKKFGCKIDLKWYVFCNFEKICKK